MMKYLVTVDVILINEKVLKSDAQIRDRKVLESAVARPQASAFGQDAYPTVHEKAAALLHSLVLNHPFVDGNKRTGIIACVIFLNENGFVEVWEEDDAYHFIIAVAEGKHTVAEISEWLIQNTKPVS